MTAMFTCHDTPNNWRPNTTSVTKVESSNPLDECERQMFEFFLGCAPSECKESAKSAPVYASLSRPSWY